MRKVSSQSRSISFSSSQIKDSIITEDFGWEADLTEAFASEKPILSGLDLIKIANKRCSLKSLFVRYKIQFEEKYSPSGWTHKCSCPFPDHRDSTPSFSYNSVEDRFSCFGCSRFGRAVEFFSIMESIPKVNAAKRLLERFDDIDDAYAEIQDTYDDKIDSLLLDFSDAINKYISNNPSSIEIVEKLTWSIDLYLQKHIPRSTIDVDNLEARIDAIKSKLI